AEPRHSPLRASPPRYYSEPAQYPPFRTCPSSSWPVSWHARCQAFPVLYIHRAFLLPLPLPAGQQQADCHPRAAQIVFLARKVLTAAEAAVFLFQTYPCPPEITMSYYNTGQAHPLQNHSNNGLQEGASF